MYILKMFVVEVPKKKEKKYKGKYSGKQKQQQRQQWAENKRQKKKTKKGQATYIEWLVWTVKESQNRGNNKNQWTQQ